MSIFDIFKKAKVTEYKNSAKITISPEPEPVKMKAAAEIEEEQLQMAVKMITQERTPKFELFIKHKSRDYTTLEYRSIDLVRLSFAAPLHHIKIGIWGKMAEKYKDSEIFKSQTNKQEVMWNSNFKEDNISAYYPIILEVFDEIENANYSINLSEQEQSYVKTTAEVLRKVIGPEGKLYVARTTEELRLHHELSALEVDFKPYKKKAWRLYCGREDEEYNLLKKLKLYTGNKKEFNGVLEISSPEEIKKFEEVFKWRYESVINSKWKKPPKKEELSYYTELDY